MTGECDIPRRIVNKSHTGVTRLWQEWKEWRRNRPNGYVAKPAKNPDGSLNLMVWECYIPGRIKTIWENGMYFLLMTFEDNYPLTPPKCKFQPPLFHPNVFDSGTLCCSLTNPNYPRPNLTIRQILYGIQDVLCMPHINHSVHNEAYTLYRVNPREYDRRVQEQARIMCGPI